MNSPTISVIVPVYNVEAYLKECIDSILLQEYEKMEIIMVDDGSTDSSGSICDEYALRHDNVIVIHQENAGLAAARNTGIYCAKGDYLLFVDSDDYIARGAIKGIIRESMSMGEPTDVIFLKIKKVFSDGTERFFGEKYDREKINHQPKEKVLKQLVKTGKFPGSSCNKMVKRKLIVDNGIFFPEGLVCEDIDWVLQLLRVAESFFYCDIDYYYYRQNRIGSITNTINIRSVKSLLEILGKWLDRNGETDPFRDIFNAFLAYEYMILLILYGTLGEDEKRGVREKIHDYKWIMRYAKGRKEKVVAFVSALFGTEITAGLLAKYQSIRS